MLVKMGYPQSVLDVVEQNRQVKNLVLSDTHLDNIIKGIKNNNDNTFEYLTKPLDFEDLWIAPPLSVNAFYNPISNEIMFPAGILQEPAFNPSYPAYINYGVIGSIMGHETTHGFDSLGSKFNSKGQLADWWTPSTKDQFNKKTQCLKDQYNGFNVTIGKNSTLPVNGDGTIVENIADNGGIERAFEAWQMYVESPKGRSANYKLKGLEKYSQEQMLFISFARLWCTPPNPMRDFFGLLSDSHAPAKWRVNGPMSNSEAFSKTFQCPTGSPMNPVKKCHVW